VANYGGGAGDLSELHLWKRVHRLANQSYGALWVALRKIGTIQRRLAWPLHKDDNAQQSGSPMGSIFILLFLRCGGGLIMTPCIFFFYRLKV
jgi:hypothetical protein